MKSNHKILVATLLWCPEGEGYNGRAEAMKSHIENLQQARTFENSPGFDFVLIDNNIRHKEFKDYITRFAYYVEDTCIVPILPERDWAGARNTILQLFMKGDWERIIFFDSDCFTEDLSWVRKVHNLIEEEPNLIAYLMDNEDSHTNYTLESGREVAVKREWLGLVNILSKESVNLVGGYDCKAMHRYGYQDCEYGRRLHNSPALSYTGGNWVDPIGVKWTCFTYPLTNKERVSRTHSVNHNSGVFGAKTRDADNKINLFFDYNYVGPEVTQV